MSDRMYHTNNYAVYLRALIFIPKINTFEGIRAYDIGTGFVRRTVPF
jgi:hypothetical protein